MSSPSLDRPELRQSFDALKTYDAGSGRAVLLPLDSAVAAASANPAQAAELERQLVGALRACNSEPARQYLCGKLKLIGSDSAISALTGLLSDPHLATAARSALEAIPGQQPGAALRERLAESGGRIGVMNSLGALRDETSVRALSTFLKRGTAAEASAVIAALGEIGSPRAARMLRAFGSKAPAELQLSLADAILTCAEKLRENGRAADALALYRFLDAPEQPKHVREASRRGQTGLR